MTMKSYRKLCDRMGWCTLTNGTGPTRKKKKEGKAKEMAQGNDGNNPLIIKQCILSRRQKGRHENATLVCGSVCVRARLLQAVC